MPITTTTTTDDVTPGEIVRTLRGLQDDIRALRGEHVRRDLYEAHRAALEAEMARLAEQHRADVARIEAVADQRDRDRAATDAERARDAAQWRRQLIAVGLAAALSLLVALATAMVG